MSLSWPEVLAAVALLLIVADVARHRAVTMSLFGLALLALAVLILAGRVNA